MDDGFARLALLTLHRDGPDLRRQLLAHPALDAMVRHQHLSGRAGVAPAALLDEVLAAVRLARPSDRVLAAWHGRHLELGRHAAAAARYLPAVTALRGTLFLVAGYDIGVASPPDLLLNVTHPRFLADPRELAFYATHEAHHVGFFARRPAPALRGLEDRAHLRAVVRYFTQLEGLAVHAARAPRTARGALAADPDYAIYADVDVARRATTRYAGLWARLAGTGRLADAEVGTVLEAMSSGERLWYRFGARVAWTLEREQGADALVGSIDHPERFDAVADALLRAAAG